MEDITEDFLKNNDGKIVWIRDDYLFMRGLISDDHDSRKILDKIADLKTTMRKRGHVFIA